MPEANLHDWFMRIILAILFSMYFLHIQKVQFQLEEKSNAGTVCTLDTPTTLDKLTTCASINEWLSMMIYIIIDRSVG